jgi:glycosyltransferase involved in cell wall biosynthesis
MRLIFDLFPCQTDSRLRGIGRYTLALAKAMAAETGGHDIRLLANGLYPATMSHLRQEFSGLVPPGAFASYTHHPFAAHESCNMQQQQIASALVHTAYQSIGADALLHASPFEGWCEQGIVAQTQEGFPAGLKVALLYDFIPWLFPEQHLDPAPAYKEWYAARLAALDQYDLLLAISEATRDDAIRLLGIAPERVVNISGAADAIFRKLTTTELAGIDIRRFGIERPFVMYTGNGDYRKNLSGMVAAYADLPPALRATHQLVVNQVGNREQFNQFCHAHGLDDTDVVVTGHITDDELLALYNQCAVFVFPSLYEGFGLPVLEAMACGAPVLAADNSSIPEVVGRTDLLFDATSPSDISARIEQALVNPAWCEEMRAYSLERAAQFSWDKCASAAWQAIEHALQARQVRIRAALQAPRLPRKRIAAVLAVPPGPAYDRAASMVAALARHFDIEVVSDSQLPSKHYLTRQTLPRQWQRFDTVFYIAALETITPAFVELVRSAPGMLLLQVPGNAKPLHATTLPTAVGHINQVLRDEGLQGLAALHRQQPNHSGTALPLPRSLLEGLSGLVLEGGQAFASALTAACPALALPAITVLPDDAAARSQRTQLLATALHHGIDKNWRQASVNIAQAWRGIIPDEVQLNETAQHAERNLRLNRSARLLVDVTQMAKTDALSGIQRVVRNIARELCMLDEVDIPIELVELRDNVLHRANGVAVSVLDLIDDACPPAQIDIQPGDILLMIDSSWEQYPYFAPVFDTVRQFGGRIVTVIYDLIPLRMPEFCSAGLVAVFQQWIGLAVQHSDMLLCISRAVRDDVRAYIAEQDLPHQNTLRLEYWHLGADIMPQPRDVHVRPLVAELVADQVHPLFLMVGTIEPRKGHAVVLDAFELLWARGSQVRLCLAGKEGWEVDALMARIRLHPELGRRLYFIERFSDAEINLCYATAHGLIAASVAEGYGLPIVEAAQHQVPVLATDIPVFREVAGTGARYFPVGDSFALAELILEFAGLTLVERRDLAARVVILSWQESARRAWQTVRSSSEMRRDVSSVELQLSNEDNQFSVATV